jgi:hypothetical protein
MFKIVLFLTIICGAVNAQEKNDSIPANFWVPNAAVGVNISQVSFNNWVQGGENTFAWTFLTQLGIKYLGEEWTFRNNFRASYGRTKLGSNDFRTNENEIYLETILSKNIEWEIDPYISNTVRTAITTGYNYRVTPPVKIADFFDPGYVTQGVGFTYDRYFGFKTRLGFAVQETFTNQYTQYSDDTATVHVERFKIETGLESVTTIEYLFLENMNFKSRLRLFSRYENLSIWDIRWESSVIAKINNFINVNFAFNLIYEQKQSVYTQIKQALQLGITYTIL